jgi:SAM-dependent methyltransferase
VAEFTRDVATAAGAVVFRVRLQVCATCGLVFWSPRLSATALAQYYRTVIRPPVPPRAQEGEFRASVRNRVEFLRQYLAGGAVLEIGCGDGRFLECAREAGFQVYGVEPSLDYCLAARHNTGTTEIENAVFDEYRPTRTFAAVCAFFVIEHVTDPVAFLGKVRGMLAPGGLLFLEAPVIDLYPQQDEEMLWHEHTYHFSAGTLRRLLNECGYELLATRMPAVSYPFGIGMLARSAGDLPRPGSLADPEEVHFARTCLARYLARKQQVDRSLAAVVTRAAESLGGAPVVVYGTGQSMSVLFEQTPVRRLNLVALADDNPERVGREAQGMKVVALATALRLNPAAVLLATDTFYDEMEARVRAEAARLALAVPRILKPFRELKQYAPSPG